CPEARRSASGHACDATPRVAAALPTHRRLHRPLDARRHAAPRADLRPNGRIAALPRHVFPRLGVHLREIRAPLRVRRPTRSMLWANSGLEPSRCGRRLCLAGVDDLWSIRDLTAVVATRTRSRQSVYTNTGAGEASCRAAEGAAHTREARYSATNCVGVWKTASTLLPSGSRTKAA